MLESLLLASLGGAIIGVASSMMLVFNGRVTGISGIYNGILSFVKTDLMWRIAFVLGIILGGTVMFAVKPELFVNETGRSLGAIAVAGLIVGFGTIMGSGCTSGHGVCGISRMSVRSLIATASFMGAGFLTATVLKHVFEF